MMKASIDNRNNGIQAYKQSPSLELSRNIISLTLNCVITTYEIKQVKVIFILNVSHVSIAHQCHIKVLASMRWDPAACSSVHLRIAADTSLLHRCARQK